uniref:Uncharacterized protein ORF-lam33_017 n=1 Tax=Saccharolobus solfataricus TaxID=2287 RepID=Q9UXM7_SACSO|nr:hypothetical protein [Saccharolobus solfataricus P2]
MPSLTTTLAITLMPRSIEATLFPFGLEIWMDFLSPLTTCLLFFPAFVSSTPTSIGMCAYQAFLVSSKIISSLPCLPYHFSLPMKSISMSKSLRINLWFSASTL